MWSSQHLRSLLNNSHNKTRKTQIIWWSGRLEMRTHPDSTARSATGINTYPWTVRTNEKKKTHTQIYIIFNCYSLCIEGWFYLWSNCWLHLTRDEFLWVDLVDSLNQIGKPKEKKPCGRVFLVLPQYLHIPRTSLDCTWVEFTASDWSVVWFRQINGCCTSM